MIMKKKEFEETLWKNKNLDSFNKETITNYWNEYNLYFYVKYINNY